MINFFVEHIRMAVSAKTPDYRCFHTSANIYLFKAIKETLETGVKHVQSKR